VLSQFVNPSAEDIAIQMLVLGLVFITIGIISENAWGLAAA
jgi:threonine/homoserine/homoserine lactone efflux protein